MLVIPIKDSIVYIQPLYLQAEQTAIPELTRVIVVYADRVEMENTLGGGAPQGVRAAGAGNDQCGGRRLRARRPAVRSGSRRRGQGSLQDIAAAQQLYLDAIAAQRKGDWATYGSKVEELGKVLSRLAAAGEHGDAQEVATRRGIA